MIAQYEQPMFEKEISALLDYYQIDLSGQAVFIDEGFEWLVSQADKYKIYYIVNPFFVLDIRNGMPRNHSKKYTYEEADYVIDILRDEELGDFESKVNYLCGIGRYFMILGPYKRPEEFTKEDALRFDRIIESCIDGRCWYIRIPDENLILAEGDLEND